MTLKTKKLTAAILTLLTLDISVAEAAREGPIGPRGAKGAQGPKGAPGVAGQRGVAGPAGAQGTAGTNGTNGTHAVDGNAVGDTLVWDGTAWTPTSARSGSTGFAYSNTCGISGTDACKIGAVGPGGGWIFFVDYNDQYPNFDYLEAAPEDLVSAPWGTNTTNCYNTANNTLVRCDGNGIDGSIYLYANQIASRMASTAVGMGQTNTTDIITIVGAGNYAANLAHAYSTPTAAAGGWFLPSKGEAVLMVTNMTAAGIANFQSSMYWTSSDIGQFALIVDLSTRSNYMGGASIPSAIKYQPQYARAIRSF